MHRARVFGSIMRVCMCLSVCMHGCLRVVREMRACSVCMRAAKRVSVKSVKRYASRLCIHARQCADSMDCVLDELAVSCSRVLLRSCLSCICLCFVLCALRFVCYVRCRRRWCAQLGHHHRVRVDAHCARPPRPQLRQRGRGRGCERVAGQAIKQPSERATPPSALLDLSISDTSSTSNESVSQSTTTATTSNTSKQ